MDFVLSVITVYHECAYLFFFFMFMYVCVLRAYSAHGGQKRVWDLLPGTGVKDGLTVVWVLGIKLESSGRTARACNC